MTTRKSIAERFWAKVQKTDDCWLWQGAKDGSHYGSIKVAGRQTRAHRLSYTLFVGEIGTGQIVCHRCDVKLCVRPSHLFAGTHADNAADRNAKNRQARGARLRKPRGEQHRNAILTESHVREIYALHRTASRRVIAQRYGTTSTNVQAIHEGRSWKHLNLGGKRPW